MKIESIQVHWDRDYGCLRRLGFSFFVNGWVLFQFEPSFKAFYKILKFFIKNATTTLFRSRKMKKKYSHAVVEIYNLGGIKNLRGIYTSEEEAKKDLEKMSVSEKCYLKILTKDEYLNYPD